MKAQTRLTVAALAASALALGAIDALASPKMVSDAKKAGLPAKNCQYCHTESTPKKETYKEENLNDRGKFLIEDKKKRNLKAADPAALKSFPGAADKK
jgi:hypothetical protein